MYNRLYKNKYIDVIVLATYYRLVRYFDLFVFPSLLDFITTIWTLLQNTPEALEEAYALWSRMTEAGNKVQFRKSRTFVAGLAVKQNQPEMALKILEGETTYVTMRHIKLLAWSQLGQFDMVFEMFRTILKRKQDEKKYEPQTSISVVSIEWFIWVKKNLCNSKCVFPQLNDIERSIKRKGSEDDRKEFRTLRDKIESLELVTKQVHAEW